MYIDSMTSIQNHLFQKTRAGGYTYTSELQPEQNKNGEMCVSLEAPTAARLTHTHHNISSWRLVPKQDHLTCFLAGSLMLGAVTIDTNVPRHKISRPPGPDQLSEQGLRDWKAGSELLKTCLHTHDTATYVEFGSQSELTLEWCLLMSAMDLNRGLSPEIVHFRIASDGMDEMPNAPPDWYIKGARYVTPRHCPSFQLTVG